MDPLLVAAIDFGTTYSGWACSFKHEFDRDPLKILAKTWTGGQLASQKGPTCVLIKSDGKTLESFGYDAETKYAELALEGKHKQWYFFKRFKMMLFRKNNQQGIERRSTLNDASGKPLPAKTVFTLAIKYLKDDLITTTAKTVVSGELTVADIHWVLTVPAIWDDAAKQFMREAAQDAGIDADKLTICLEPKVASLYCRHLPVGKTQGKIKGSLATFCPGTVYMVLDAGGGTVDVTVHEIMENGSLRELHKASGGAWGGTRVDDAFEYLLGRILGQKVIKEFKEQHMDDYIELFRDFEIKKRALSKEQKTKITMRLPSSLFDQTVKSTGRTVEDCVSRSIYKDLIVVMNDKIRIEPEVAQGCFKLPNRSVLSHVEELLQHPKVSACAAIVMVGGFSESPILQEAVNGQFGYLDIIIPNEAGLAVLKGAVIYGHNPTAIAERVCKYTYGTDVTHKTDKDCTHPPCRQEVDKNGDMRCYDIFDIHVRTGQSEKLGEYGQESIVSPIYEDQESIKWDIFASSKSDPKSVTEEGCTKIGNLTVPIYDSTLGTERKFGASFKFGGTEIEVKVEDKATGEITTKTVDFLG